MQTEAEKAAWKLCEAEGLDLVTIHPCHVLGPVISTRTDAPTVSNFKARSPGKRQQCSRIASLSGG